MSATKPPRRRSRRADGLATRRRILEAATRMFAAGGYEATSLRQIAGAAEIDLATLKYHFTDKPNLFAEVYREGHGEFLAMIGVHLTQMDGIETREAMAAHIRGLVGAVHDFFDVHMPFVRMVLYRLLEDASDVIAVEDELQGVAITMIERAFEGLIERGVIRPIDVRAMITLMVSSFSMWFVTARVKPTWVGAPQPEASGEGRARSEAFFVDMLERVLLPG